METNMAFGRDGEMTYTVPANATAMTDAVLASGDGLMDECLEAYGWDHEMMMLVEECGELIQAAIKVQRSREDENAYPKAVHHLAEEMADVRIMLSQMTVMFDCDADVAGWAKSKLERTYLRLQERGF